MLAARSPLSLSDPQFNTSVDAQRPGSTINRDNNAISGGFFQGHMSRMWTKRAQGKDRDKEDEGAEGGGEDEEKGQDKRRGIGGYVKQDEELSYTVAVLGGGATGKSSLITRMLRDDFVEDVIDPTLLDEYSGRCTFESKLVHVTLMDTAGQEQYAEHRAEAINQAQGYLLVYDVTQRVSFEEIEVFMNELSRVRLRDTRELPIVVVGNKGDTSEELHQVSKAEAVAYAESIGCPLMEASAKTGKNAHKIMEKVLQEIAYHARRVKRGGLSHMRGTGSAQPANSTPTLTRFTLGVVPKWRKRYVVLDGTRLAIFKNINKPTPIAEIDLASVVGVRDAEKETREENTFLLKLALHTHVFRAQSQEERDSWALEIRRHASKAQDREIGDGDEYILAGHGVPLEEYRKGDKRDDELSFVFEARAVQSHKAMTETDLRFREGQLIRIIKVDDHGNRYKGVIGRRKGWFPKQYVRPIDHHRFRAHASATRRPLSSILPRRTSVPDIAAADIGAKPVVVNATPPDVQEAAATEVPSAAKNGDSSTELNETQVAAARSGSAIRALAAEVSPAGSGSRTTVGRSILANSSNAASELIGDGAGNDRDTFLAVQRRKKKKKDKKQRGSVIGIISAGKKGKLKARDLLKDNDYEEGERETDKAHPKEKKRGGTKNASGSETEKKDDTEDGGDGDEKKKEATEQPGERQERKRSKEKSKAKEKRKPKQKPESEARDESAKGESRRSRSKDKRASLD